MPSTITLNAITADAKGNIGFFDGVHLREVTAQSTIKTLAGGTAQTAPDGTPLRDASFQNPKSLAFDHKGNLYFAEFQSCLIRKDDTAGVLSTFAGSGKCGSSVPSGNAKTADLVSPVSIVVDSQNRVWVSDFFGNIYTSMRRTEPSRLIAPRIPSAAVSQLAIDSKDRADVWGTLLVSLIRILPDLSTQTIVAAPTAPGVPPPGFVQVTGLGTDRSGSVYFASNADIYRINDDASYTQVAQNQQGGASATLAVDSAGNIWQSDGSGFTITSSSGTAFLGGLRPGFSGDGGFAQTASFSNVTSMAYAPNGDLYFIDGPCIRKLSGSGPAAPPAISPNGVVNAASYAGGGIAPGELVSIFGTNFGVNPLELFTGAVVNNALPTAVRRTKVLFNGTLGAITAVTSGQINVFVPYLFQSNPATLRGCGGRG